MYPKPKKTQKCVECGTPFEINSSGRPKFYKTKFCSNECANASRKKSQKANSKIQAEKNKKKYLEYKDVHGKVKKDCKTCGKEYETYSSHIQARGSSYCSKDCMKKGKVKSKSIPRLTKEFWSVFSRYTRLRDAIRTTGDCNYVKCITCGEIKKTVETDAGHFFSRTVRSIMFDEFNVHAQCKKCNMPPNSGEQYKYSLRIIELYGQEKLDYLESQRSKTFKFSESYLIENIEKYKLLLKSLIKEHGSPWRSTI